MIFARDPRSARCYATLRIRSLAEHFLAPAFLKTLWTVFLFDVAIGVLL